jgi:hypothetical protein
MSDTDTDWVSPLDPRVRGDDPLAPRAPSLAGRRVALLDIGKNRGAEFLDRIEQHLRAAGASTERFAKPLFSRAASGELIERVAIHGDLAVEGLAD